jgi:hypothetical protein
MKLDLENSKEKLNIKNNKIIEFQNKFKDIEKLNTKLQNKLYDMQKKISLLDKQL